MTLASSNLSCSLTISQIDVIGVPRAKNYWNEFDEHGLVVGVKRSVGEKNWNHRRRLYDAFSHIANSTYQGLVNGITRELGLELYSPILLQPKLSPKTGKLYAADPYIRINGSYVYLYSDYENNVLECKIDRFEPGGNYEKLEWLVEVVNTTTYFEAGLINNGYRLDSSMALVNQTSRGTFMEMMQPTTKFQFRYKYIVPGSVRFLDGSSSFRVEMRHIDEVDRSGRFFIDYSKGIITVYDLPPVKTTIQYQYTKYPFYPIASPVIIGEIDNEDFKVKMFEQVLQEDGEYVNGMPTEFGNDILNKLMSIYPMYWGT